MVNDAGCHSFDVLMSKTRQQNDSQHLLNPLNHYNERTYCRLKSKLRKQLRKKTSDAASPKSVKSRLVDYIHLNPARAGICAVEDLKSYALSSYPKYFKHSPVDALHREDFLGILELPDSLAGMNRYAKYLALSEAQDPKQKEALMKQYCRGWFIGSKETKKALAKNTAKQHPDVDWEGANLQELNESKWELLVVHELKRAGKTKTDIANEAKGAAWKIEIAQVLRKQTTANNSWIAQRLNMGHPSRVSNLIQNIT
jgi:hypothetical protein